MADMKKKVALIVLDGWGYGLKDSSDAIHNANTPCVDELHASVPHASLRTDGNFVGLPLGQMGNSEVGHMNIGAGRIVFQDLLRINTAIEKGTFSKGTFVISINSKSLITFLTNKIASCAKFACFMGFLDKTLEYKIHFFDESASISFRTSFLAVSFLIGLNFDISIKSGITCIGFLNLGNLFNISLFIRFDITTISS